MRSPPSLLTPPLLLHFSECLKGPVVKMESVFKDCSGCDWMGRLMKLDRHKKCVAQETNGGCRTVFCDESDSPQKRPHDWWWLLDHYCYIKTFMYIKKKYSSCIYISVDLNYAFLICQYWSIYLCKTHIKTTYLIFKSVSLSVFFLIDIF